MDDAGKVSDDDIKYRSSTTNNEFVEAFGLRPSIATHTVENRSKVKITFADR